MKNTFFLNIQRDWPKIAAAALASIMFLLLPTQAAFFWSIFFIWWTWKMDNRILAAVALIFLLFIPLFLAFHQEVIAEQFAVYVFYLLSMTVALQVIEMLTERNNKPETVEDFNTIETTPLYEETLKPAPVFSRIRDTQRPLRRKSMADILPKEEFVRRRTVKGQARPSARILDLREAKHKAGAMYDRVR